MGVAVAVGTVVEEVRAQLAPMRGRVYTISIIDTDSAGSCRAALPAKGHQRGAKLALA